MREQNQGSSRTPTMTKRPAGINAKQPHWKKHGSEISYTFIDCIASQWEELIG